MRVPDSLLRLRGSDEGQAWLAALPDLVQSAVDRWHLTIDKSFPYAYCSLALAAVNSLGREVVLKVPFPHRESWHEADALALWAGHGAVRLLDRDPDAGAMLLERCRPGTDLSAVPAPEAVDVVAGILPRSWLPAGEPFRPLADEASWWASYLPDRWVATGRVIPERILDAALAALDRLPHTQGPAVLVNQDLHAGNVLRAEREPWLVIDPKPLAGEREFGLASVVRDRVLGHSRHEVVGRLDELTGRLGLDRERARGWALAQTVAWSFDGGQVLPSHVEVAGWLTDA